MTMEEFLKEPTVENFCNLENADKFDFSNDGATKEFRAIVDPIEKYFTFKAVVINEEEWKKGDKRKYRGGIVYPIGLYYSAWAKKTFKSISDPDSKSQLLQAIYTELWEDSHLTVCRPNKDPNKEIKGDTLISAQTTLNSTIEKFNLGTYHKRYGNYSIKYAISLYAAFREAFSNELNFVDGLTAFLAVYHTLGNFMPVPACFNTSRSKLTKDYWDITLYGLYRWFNQTDSLNSIIDKSKYFPNITQNIDDCVEWLTTYGEGESGWKNFVEKNYLQDFVNVNPDGGYGEPIELWTNHFSKQLKPQGEEEIKQFYTKASRLIRDRGGRMLKALKEKKGEEENKAKENE